MIDYKKEHLLCFIHGWACSPTDFQNQLAYFSQENLLALDYTSNIIGNPSINTTFDECRTRLLNNIINKSQGKSVVIIAHSLGGILSLAWLNSLNVNIKGMILLDSSLEISDEKVTAYKQLSQVIQTHNAANALSDFFDSKMTISELDNTELMDQKKQEMIDACLSQPSYFSNLLLGAIRESSHRYLHKTNVPILYIGSANPYTTKQTLTTINSNIQFKHINHSGHFIMLNSPIIVNNYISSFLSEIDR